MSAIDLQKLPKPDAIETVDYEQLNTAWQDELTSKDPDFDALLESDPAVIEMEVGAYREVLTRQRVNDGAKSVMLPYAKGNDLDVIAANYNVERLLITEADDTAIPPIAAVYEDDEDFRRRIQLRWESVTTAGSIGSYKYHALSTDGQVRDVYVYSPNPCEIEIYVLSHDGDGIPSAELLDKVRVGVGEETVRPTGDRVTVKPAEIVLVTLEATLDMASGPDSNLVLQAAQDAAAEVLSPRYPLGKPVPKSALYAALHQTGVTKVNMVKPEADIPVDNHQAIWVEEFKVAVGVIA